MDPSKARASRGLHRTLDAGTPLMKPSARDSVVKVAAEPTKPSTSGSGKVINAKGHNTEGMPRHRRSISRPPQPRPSRRQQPTRSTSCSAIVTASAENAAPFACRLRSWKELKELKTVETKTKKAPFRPASRNPFPLSATLDYPSFRKLHRRYYNSIRHTFLASTSSADSSSDRHAKCKISNAACKQTEQRPPWDDSTKVSLAPGGFQFTAPLRRTTRKTGARPKKGDGSEDEASFAGTSGCETATKPKGASQLSDFSFLFKPSSFFFRSPSKKLDKSDEKTPAEEKAPASVGKAGNKTKEKALAEKDAPAGVGNFENKTEKEAPAEEAPAEEDAPAGVGNSGPASPDTKLGGSRRRHLASKENKPPVESRSSTKSNALSKQKEANSCSSPSDKENLKSHYNLRTIKKTSRQAV